MGPISVKLTGDLYASVCQDEPLLKAHVATIRLADVGELAHTNLLAQSNAMSLNDTAELACRVASRLTGGAPCEWQLLNTQ
jgi:hypothetical protein